MLYKQGINGYFFIFSLYCNKQTKHEQARTKKIHQGTIEGAT